MNIFDVLNTGKSSLHEPSISAMFAYLLNPNQDHGLGNKVINGFLQLANTHSVYDNFINNNTLKFEIDLEVSYWHHDKRNDIDIQIKVLNNSYQELHRIIIENKIKQNSSNAKQLKAYYEAVLGDKNNDDYFDLGRENLSVIFLTPPKNKGLQEEFDNLNIENKQWIFWNDEQNDSTIVNLIQNILQLEQKA
jgi:hypothetical protein